MPPPIESPVESHVPQSPNETPGPSASEPVEETDSAVPSARFQVDRQPMDPAFFGPNGVRAGWRLLLFLALQMMAATVITVFRHLGPAWLASPGTTVSVLTPQYFLITETIAFAEYFIATWIMGRIEGRAIADYGLPATGVMRGRFWLGLGAGFVSISVLLGAMALAGAFRLEGLALHGSEAFSYALLWGGAMLLVGLQEEFRGRGGRGYVLFTLATGIGFWPAALITSLWFGYNHHTNPGESPLGLLSVFGIGMFFCILVRKTGDLWAGIGFHAAWDFGLTYVYGVPDSGLAETGHLLNPRFSGPAWLTGGSAGPEASVLCLLLIFTLSVATLLFFPQAKYPNPSAVRDPRAGADSPERSAAASASS
jgi:CAAX protease family protein